MGVETGSQAGPKEDSSGPNYEAVIPEDNWLGVTSEELESMPPDLSKKIAVKVLKPTSLIERDDLSQLHDEITAARLDGTVREDYAAYFLAMIAERAEELHTAQFSAHEYSMKTTDLALIHNEERQDPINVAFRLESLTQQPWFLEAPESFQTQVTARVRLLGAAGIKRAGKLEDIVNNPSLTMRREEFKELMKCEGVWFSLQQMFNDLFEQDGTKEEKGYFAIKLKMTNPEGKVDFRRATDILNRIDEYRKELREKLMLEKGLSETDARRAVAVAYNLLFIGDAIESADKDRVAYDFVTFSSPDRAFFHPASQARAKWGIIGDVEEGHDPEKLGYDEKWGGNIGDWVIFRRETDPKFGERLLTEERIPPFTKLPFPETMMVSLFEFVEVENNQGEEINFAEALLTGDIDIGELDLDSLNAEVFGTWRDTARTVYSVYKFLTSETVGGRTPDFDFTELRGALHKLIKPGSNLPLQEVYQDPEYIAWCILGYYGLDLATSTPMVERLSLGSTSEENYTHFLKSKVFRQLGVSRDIVQEVSRLIAASDSALQRSMKRSLKSLLENW